MEVANFNNLQRLYLILSSGILQSLELITLSDGEMVRLLFCQKLLLKDYFVKEII